MAAKASGGGQQDGGAARTDALGEELDCGRRGASPRSPATLTKYIFISAQLCDDSFEEHVLPYSADMTGLHLHGLNACTKAFQTQPQPVVDAFAREWGFIPTASIVLHTIPEVKAFTEQVAQAGQWNGEAVEGFVVRTRVTAPPTKGSSDIAAPAPYPAGSSFFFKVKFDEPYLMYRDWREVTKMLLSRGPSAGNVPKGKLRRAETQLYVRWVCAEIRRDRAQFEGFTKGKGIIATRERFLQWMTSGAGADALGDDGEEGSLSVEGGSREDVDLTKGKVIIVPVAIPGVGECPFSCALDIFRHGALCLGDSRGGIACVAQARRPSQSRCSTSSGSPTSKATTSPRRRPPRSSSRTSPRRSGSTTSSSPTST